MRISDGSSDVCSSDLQQGAGGEAERAALAEQVPLQRPDAERILEREDLDADELGQPRVDAEQRGQRDEQPRGAVVDEAVHAMSAVILSAARDLRSDTGRSLAALGKIGRAQVCTPVTNEHPGSPLTLDKNK